MRWNRLFDDLEHQIASEWEAERATVETEAERLRLSRLSLHDRLSAVLDAEVVLDLCDGTAVTVRVRAVGAEWAALDEIDQPSRALLVPFWAIRSIRMPRADLLRSTRVVEADRLAGRLTLGYVLRDVSRRRIGVSIGLNGDKTLAGTVDRAGADHLDLAIHEPGAARRAAAVREHRLVPFSAIVWVRLDGPFEV